jgi:DinB superfamily/Pentapeptide repeats (8 copies)
MTEFIRQQLRNARFERVDLTGASFIGVDLANVSIRSSDLTGLRVRGSDLSDIELNGWLEGPVHVNGVDVGPLVDAELNRRYPDRAKMRPGTADGFREAWDVLERLWEQTVERARRLEPPLLHESVDGEWSFIETLRHLVFATDAWIRRAMLGDPTPWHALDLPWDEMPDTPSIPRDRAARPSLDEVLELRTDRMATVRRAVEELTDEDLAASTEPVAGEGWPPSESFPVRECLLTILNEEWEHRLYAERDLAALEARG